MLSVVVSRMGKTSILERKLTAHTTAIASSRRVCCLISEQYVAITGGHCSRMKRQRTSPGQRWTIWKKEHINFIEPHMWPPNSPDIIPVDYAIWGAHQQRVYHQRRLKTAEELKWAIVTEWQKLSQRFIDNSINEWRRRLEAVIKNGGGHIEHCNLAWAAAHHFYTIEICLVNKTKHLTPILAVVFVLLRKVVTQ